MLVQLPLHLNTLPGKPTPGDLETVLRRHYEGSEWVKVEDLERMQSRSAWEEFDTAPTEETFDIF